MGSLLRVAARAAALVVAVCLIALAWAGVALLRSRADVAAARAELEQARHPSTTTQTSTLLAAASQRLERVDDRLSLPGPALAAHLPWVGHTVAAVATTVRATLSVAAALGPVVRDARGAVQDGGRVDLARLATLQVDLRRAARSTAGPVAQLRRAPTSLIPGSVATGMATATSQLASVPDALSRAADAVSGAADLLGAHGPRRLLVVLENNAELRGTGGLVSVFAEGSTAAGRLHLQPFRDVQDVADVVGSQHPPHRVAAPADYRRLWGPYLADTTLWKNTNMSPDIPTSSAVLAAVAAASLGRRPDAVVWLDVRTIAAVLAATGPATLPDGTVMTGDTAVSQLLSQTYRSTADDQIAQGLRRARLRAAADVVLHRILGGAPDLVRLAPQLAQAAAGRHLAVWSAAPAQEQAWARGGADGAVTAGAGDLVDVSVQNFGGGDRNGNKLDYYARRLVTVTTVVSASRAEVQEVVTLRNTAPLHGLPGYVAGRATPGVTNNFLTFAAPRHATLLEFSRGGLDVHTEVLAEGDHQVLTDLVSLPPGTSATWRLRYTVPLRAGAYQLRLVPQPLAVDAGMSVDIRAAAGLDLAGGEVRSSGPFAATRSYTARVAQPGWFGRLLNAVRRFWSQPVRLPG